jgi:hypothetical protein
MFEWGAAQRPFVFPPRSDYSGVAALQWYQGFLVAGNGDAVAKRKEATRDAAREGHPSWVDGADLA